MKQKSAPWIRVWPFDNRELIINNSGSRIRLSQEAKDYINKNWETDHKGWTSSWIPLVENVLFEKKKIQVNCGAIAFKDAIGLVKSIGGGKSYIPQGYVNELSIGFLTATKEGYVIFQRRASDVHCPNTLIHEPCGYLKEDYLPKKKWGLQKNRNDQRLFNLKTQLDFRKKEIADLFGISEELVLYDPIQDFLACGWMTREMYFSTTGKIDCSQSDLEKSFKQKISQARKNNDERTAKKLESLEFFFVPFENLKDLINNQGKLSRVNPIGYRPSNPTQIPGLDETIVGLIFNGYEKLTGDKLDISDTLGRLKHDGLEILVHDTSPESHYDFPLEFGFSPPNEIKRLIMGANTKIFKYFTEQDKATIKSFYSRKRDKNKIKNICPESLMQNLFNSLSPDFNFDTEVHNAITRRRNNPAKYIEGYCFVDKKGQPIQDYRITREKVLKGLVNYLCAIKNNPGKSQEIKGKNLVKYLK